MAVSGVQNSGFAMGPMLGGMSSGASFGSGQVSAGMGQGFSAPGMTANMGSQVQGSGVDLKQVAALMILKSMADSGSQSGSHQKSDPLMNLMMLSMLNQMMFQGQNQGGGSQFQMNFGQEAQVAYNAQSGNMLASLGQSLNVMA